MNLIPEQWHSARLSLSDLKENEIPAVQKLYETSRYMNEWDGETYKPDHIQNCLFNGNLPPGGVLRNYRMQTVRNRENASLIGILSVYHGHPSSESVYLEFLYIDSNIQKQGFGQELTNRFTEVVADLGYREIRLNVALKNWPALRFWTQCGFDRISGIFGDRQISDNAFANLELVKTL
ncbi:GNAT family N-acetyltransferase [Saccharibacillus sacchari]|uniref:GNAT family N-acetyltransferase n=1 Tax=Saccharibacillus sacchari TaxID=456493 RepID=A0ACC6PAU6_9BACL